VRQRPVQPGRDPPVVPAQHPDYLADLLARITLAMIRSAMIRHAQLSRDPGRETVPASVLVDQALSILSIPGSGEVGPESGLTMGKSL
jgi:hypothetical protein